MTTLNPLPGHALVELREKYGEIATTEQKYDTRTSGICLKINSYSPEDFDHLLGSLVFWEEYKDGAVIERDGKRYAFIKIADLTGWEDDKS